jgi:hypothetical protein
VSIGLPRNLPSSLYMDWDADEGGGAESAGEGEGLPSKPTMRWVKEVLGDDAEVDEENGDGIFAGSKASVAVAVRVRPLSAREKREGYSSVVSVPSPTTIRAESSVRFCRGPTCARAWAGSGEGAV